MIEKLWLCRKEWNEKHYKWSATHFQKIDIDDMASVIEKLAKSANLCAKELEANEVSRIFKTEIEKYKEVLLTL
jgi:dynein heavy chain